jgi:hypothetical protein
MRTSTSGVDTGGAPPAGVTRFGALASRGWLLPAALLPALLLVALARAASPPLLKEGLWQVQGEIVENPGDKHRAFAYRVCRNHAYDRSMDERVREVQGCRTSVSDHGHGRFMSSSRCTVDNVVIDSQGTTFYESDTATHAESHSTYSPAYHGRTDETIVQDQRYLGNCPQGMQPGDRLMPDGSLQRYTR